MRNLFGETDESSIDDKIREVLDYYRTKRPLWRSDTKNGKAWKLVQSRLCEYSVDELKQAIDGNYSSPFHCGQNDRNREYHEITLIMREDKVAGFIEIAAVGNKPKLNERTARNFSVGDDWLDGKGCMAAFCVECGRMRQHVRASQNLIQCDTCGRTRDG